MRQYSSEYKPGAHDTSELDPCIAAETRMKKSVMGNTMKRSLVLLAVFLCFILVLSLLIIVLVFGGDSTSIDYDQHTALDEGDGVFGGVVYDDQAKVNTWASTHGAAVLEKMYQKTEPPRSLTKFLTTTSKTPVTNTRLTTTHPSISISNTTTAIVVNQGTITPAITISSFITESNEVISNEVKSNCFEHLIDGHGSGIYHISPNGVNQFDAFCDQETDGGGWTVIQKRLNGWVYFYNRTWSEYEHGFGSLSNSHWLGLKNIYQLAPWNGAWWTLRIELRGDHCNKPTKCSGKPDGYWWAEWDFKLGDAASNYVLNLSTARRGNLTDTLTPDNFFKLNGGRPFTTIDRDNDRNTDFNCAQFRNYGGWWHHDCGYVALNGLYGDTEPKMRYMVYFYHQPVIRGRIGLSYHIHPKQSIMMIRPKF